MSKKEIKARTEAIKKAREIKMKLQYAKVIVIALCIGIPVFLLHAFGGML